MTTVDKLMIEGRQHMYSGDFEAANNAYSAALNRSDSSAIPKAIPQMIHYSRGLARMAWAGSLSYDPNQAENRHILVTGAYSDFELTEDLGTGPEGYLGIAKLLEFEKEKEKAHLALDCALTKTKFDTMGHIEAVLGRMSVFLSSGLLGHAYSYGQTALEYLSENGQECQKDKQDEIQALAYSLMAECLGKAFVSKDHCPHSPFDYDISENDQCQQLYDYNSKAIDIFNELGDEESLTRVILNFGAAAKMMNSTGIINHYVWIDSTIKDLDRARGVLAFFMARDYCIEEHIPERALGYFDVFSKALFKGKIKEQDMAELEEDWMNFFEHDDFFKQNSGHSQVAGRFQAFFLEHENRRKISKTIDLEHVLAE
ncbi:MAG: hypothetical protein KJ709_05775 [Nanoarchaeota archaeon]|nr:hypothetical protein [Nanoarchaeota archaeon]